MHGGRGCRPQKESHSWDNLYGRPIAKRRQRVRAECAVQNGIVENAKVGGRLALLLVLNLLQYLLERAHCPHTGRSIDGRRIVLLFMLHAHLGYAIHKQIGRVAFRVAVYCDWDAAVTQVTIHFGLCGVVEGREEGWKLR